MDNQFRTVTCLLCSKEGLACHLIRCELKPGALASLGRPDITYFHKSCLDRLRSHPYPETLPSSGGRGRL